MLILKSTLPLVLFALVKNVHSSGDQHSVSTDLVLSPSHQTATDVREQSDDQPDGSHQFTQGIMVAEEDEIEIMTPLPPLPPSSSSSNSGSSSVDTLPVLNVSLSHNVSSSIDVSIDKENVPKSQELRVCIATRLEHLRAHINAQEGIEKCPGSIVSFNQGATVNELLKHAPNKFVVKTRIVGE